MWLLRRFIRPRQHTPSSAIAGLAAIIIPLVGAGLGVRVIGRRGLGPGQSGRRRDGTAAVGIQDIGGGKPTAPAAKTARRFP
jgi:hypothetical protein